MSEVSFKDDPFAWRVTRFFVLVQIVGMLIVVGLSLFGRFFLALAISFLTFLAFLAILVWLYSRYRDIPIVCERRELERLVRKFQKGAQTEGSIIRAAIEEREVLTQAEKLEIHNTLKAVQASHMERGLMEASLSEAVIPEMGPKLKERLASYGVTNAAQVTAEIAELPDLDESKRQALLDWRRSVLERLEQTKPEVLPDEQLEPIQRKYTNLQEKNEADERKARASKIMLEHELTSFRPRIRQLAGLTFLNYLSNSLASRGVVATLIAFILILAQVVSSVSATASTASSFLASIAAAKPSATPISTATAAPPTMTLASSPTIVLAASATTAPLVTETPIPTHTPVASFTALVVVQPSDTPYIPVSGVETQSNCDPSYPGVCIPPAPPDLDCGDVPYKRFQVLPPDPHHFDRDADGIGCES